MIDMVFVHELLVCVCGYEDDTESYCQCICSLCEGDSFL